MRTRNPIVAGQFYPAERDSCIDEMRECLGARELPASLPDEIAAGIVPHAGWIFSGELAAMVFAAVRKRHEKVDTFVILGAAHSYYGPSPAVSDSESWRTPLGVVPVDEEMAARIVETGAAVASADAHRAEHSIEVQAPFVQMLFPDSRILPIVVPPAQEAILLGQAIAGIIADSGKKVVCIGSTDLTHYGPRYGFAPMGSGPEAIKWASDVNDSEFIAAAVKLDPQAMLDTAAANFNACGSGAAAATVEAARNLGKTEGLLLAHTNSNEAMRKKFGRSASESVGYAAIVF